MGERWLRQTLGTFFTWLPVPLTDVGREHLVGFLGQWEDKPWQKHSMYRSLRTFWRWVSTTYQIPNPMRDQFGNPIVAAPKTPDKILYTITPVDVCRLVDMASSIRDKAIISLLADSGARRSEITSIQVCDVDLSLYRIKVVGKGNKEGKLVFGDKTKALLAQYIQEAQPVGKLFGLSSEGLKTMLRRLEDRTDIKCNSHSFRRGFATELRRKGLSELDIAELGRWSSTAMVKRYSRAYTFDDAAARYKPIMT
jgi:integrase/recombinase XerD